VDLREYSFAQVEQATLQLSLH